MSVNVLSIVSWMSWLCKLCVYYYVWISCHVIIASIKWTFLIQSKTGFPPILDVCLDQFCQSIWLKSLFTSLDGVMLDSLSFSRYKRRSFLVCYCRLETVVMPSRSILMVSLFAYSHLKILLSHALPYLTQSSLCVLSVVLALAVAAPHRQRRQFDNYMGGDMNGYGNWISYVDLIAIGV